MPKKDNQKYNQNIVASKKRRKSYTLTDKKKIVDDYKKYGMKYVRETHGAVSKSSVMNWNRDYTSIINHKSPKQRRRLKKTKTGTILGEELEKQICEKIYTKRDSGIAISGESIKRFAKIIAKDNDITFVASNGWLDGFRKRHQLVIRKGTKRTAKISPDIIPAMKKWHTDFMADITKDDYDYAINIDQTPICFELTHNTTIERKGAPEVIINTVKNPTKKITVTLGMILPLKSSVPQVYKCIPQLIAKGKTDKCVKPLLDSIKGQPESECTIRFSATAWSNQTLFADYIRNNIPQELNGFKALVTFDNFQGNLGETVDTALKERNFSSSTLPPNSTAFIQPLDVGINKPFKSHLKNIYSKKVEKGPENALLSLNYVILYPIIIEAWKKIKQESIKNTFRTCGFGIQPEQLIEDETNWLRAPSLKLLRDQNIKEKNGKEAMESSGAEKRQRN